MVVPVSEIKDFSDAHIGCMDPKTMHPAKYLCTFPYMSILIVKKKGMHFRVHGPKNPCTRGSNHAPRVKGAPLISDTDCTHSVSSTREWVTSSGTTSCITGSAPMSIIIALGLSRILTDSILFDQIASILSLIFYTIGKYL